MSLCQRLTVLASAACGLLALACNAGDNEPTIVFSTATAQNAAERRFDTDAVGALPEGATPFSGIWLVRVEAGTPSAPNALCQIGNAEFPALQLGDHVYGDVAITAKFKAISGETDQAAGLLVRVQDAGNYYILRANALEDNVNLYRYAGGLRGDLEAGDADVPSGEWHELRFEVRGGNLEGFLDGRSVVRASDPSFTAGRIGLWTKADSVTCFDDVVVEPLP